jgi:hypothetical protein
MLYGLAMLIKFSTILICASVFIFGISSIFWTQAKTDQLSYEIKLGTALKDSNTDYRWLQSRVVAIPPADCNGKTRVIMSIQKELRLSDFYSGLFILHTDDMAASWSKPDERPELAWRKREGGIVIAVADPTPGWHSQTGKVIVFGCTVHYLNGKAIQPQPGATSYTVHDPKAGTWSPWQEIKMPERKDFFCVRSACSQWLNEPDGTLLVPFYFYTRQSNVCSVAVMRCSFDGKVVKYLEHGNELKLNVQRGLNEPSITFFQGRYYLTMRNNEKGYVSVSDDGLHFAPIKTWTFDDGADLGSYCTQQHWVTHSDALFLCYTRRGANNDHVLRNRAPLFLGQVDPKKLCVIRKTEQVVIGENNAAMGNFGVATIDENETWVTVGEYDEYAFPGRVASVFVARLLWSKPNRVVSRLQ